MARQRKDASKRQTTRPKDGSPPIPYKHPPDVLRPLIDTLDEKQVYITHVDSKPRDLKQKVFIVPVLMNLSIVALLVWRIYYIAPYYLNIFASMLGYFNETTMFVDEMEWEEIMPEILKRAFTFLLDFMLFVFLWPWPVEFFTAQENGNPFLWRRTVGFRNKEVVVRRGRKWAEKKGDVINDTTSKSLFIATISAATSPMILGEKTGYLLMNNEWDLDWAAMIDATTMVDQKMAAIEAFTLVVLFFHEEYGWLCVDMKQEAASEEDSRRRQVFAFRDALTEAGKENLFYRWIEIIQFESSQPAGFGADRQEEVAKEIRAMFAKEGMDFDESWREAVGADPSLGIQG